jgi:predicted acyltransferase
MLMLAAFYLVFDILPLRWLAFPLVVVGMNSLLFYMMGQLVRSWVIDKVVHVHLAGFLNDVFGPLILADEGFGRLTEPIAAFVIFWLIGLWLYRSRHFLRI